MVAIVVVLGVVVLLLLGVIAALYRRVGRSDWGVSDLRMSTLGFLAVIGPLFGVHVKPQKPEPPAVLGDRGDVDADPGPVGDLHERIEADDQLQAPPPVRRRR